MSKAEAWLLQNTPAEPDELRDWQAVRAMARRYGDLRAQEEREKVLEALEHGHTKECTGDYDKGTPCDCPGADVMGAFDEAVRCAKQELLEKWRAEDVEDWLAERNNELANDDAKWELIREALARARAQGAIHKAHTAVCAVHQSKECSCQ